MSHNNFQGYLTFNKTQLEIYLLYLHINRCLKFAISHWECNITLSGLVTDKKKNAYYEMKPIVIHSKTVIQWESGTDYCSFTPTGFQNNILFVLFMQTIPYDGFERRVWMVWGPFFNDNSLSCVAQWSVISMWYTHKRRNTKGEAAAKAFYSFHLASKQSQYRAARTMF